MPALFGGIKMKKIFILCVMIILTAAVFAQNAKSVGLTDSDVKNWAKNCVTIQKEFKKNAQMRNAIQKMVMSHSWALQLHGFYADTEKKTIRFDVVVSFDIDRKEAVETLTKEIHASYPDYELLIIPDADVAD